MIFDLAIIETGNGGDIQLLKNDLAVVQGIENMPYLAMFGGNKEQSTENVNANQPVPAQSFDWWGNNLFMQGDQSIQFNSKVEKILNTTPLTSAGRVLIENAIKKDLEFLEEIATITVVVTIVATDRIDINIEIKQTNNDQKVIIISFKKSADGDWFLFDFNDDFNV